MTVDEAPVDLLIVGGGLGGVGAALAACARGLRVVMTEEFVWVGGQATSQAVPPDEHPWIERFGCTARYRQWRDGIRAAYRTDYPLTDRARAWPELNPGAGWVSKLCHEPKVALAVIERMLAPYVENGTLDVRTGLRPVACEVDGGRIDAVELESVDDPSLRSTVRATYVIDATETGDLLPLGGADHVTGFESRADTGEPSAPAQAQPDNVQALSVCFAVDHVDGDHTIERPASYDHWRQVQPEFWGAPLLSWSAPHPRTLEIVERFFQPNPGDDPHQVNADQSLDPGDTNLWTFRRIVARDLFAAGAYDSDVTLVNWPSIDYFEGHVLNGSRESSERHIEAARQLSLSMLYWMQTEAPRPDGGTGWPGLRLRPDVMGTPDGLAMAPYHREGRRILGLERITEQDVVPRPGRSVAREYPDSVGLGMYRIDLHPSTGGDNYIDVPAAPFQIPLGALIPRNRSNLLAGGKNLGTTHITNGCYRLHPVEWNVGEAAGELVAMCLAEGLEPAEIHGDPTRVARLQERLVDAGVELAWPDDVHPY